MKPTKAQLAEIVRLHGAWLRGEAEGARADLRDAVLRGADLSGADLSDNTVLPDGVVWKTYLADVVPALLQAGGKELAAVATRETWECHSWTNCPMAQAFDVHSLSEVPPLYRAQANLFVRLYDARLIPLPATPEPVNG